MWIVQEKINGPSIHKIQHWYWPDAIIAIISYNYVSLMWGNSYSK